MTEQSPETLQSQLIVESHTILDDLISVARPEILHSYREDSCIISTAIAIDVLRHLGIQTSPLSVNLTIFNKKYMEYLETLGHYPQSGAEFEEWVKEGCYSLGVDTDTIRPGRWNGHLVAVAKRKWLLDLSANQFSRPEHDIVVTPILTQITQSFFRGREPHLIDNGQIGIIYKARPKDKSFIQSSDWLTPTSELQRVRQETARRILSLLKSYV